jgi:hypothetical protein
MLPEERAYSCCLVHLSVRCLEHNLKTLGDNLFKLHTVVTGIEMECSVKEPSLYFAVHKNCCSALPNFLVFAHCIFLHFELYAEHNSKTIRDINMKLCM